MKSKLVATLLLSGIIFSSSAHTSTSGAVTPPPGTESDSFMDQMVSSVRKMSETLAVSAPGMQLNIPETTETRGFGTLSVSLKSVFTIQAAQQNLTDPLTALSREDCLALTMDQKRTWEKLLPAYGAVQSIAGNLRGEGVPATATAASAVKALFELITKKDLTIPLTVASLRQKLEHDKVDAAWTAAIAREFSLEGVQASHSAIIGLLLDIHELGIVGAFQKAPADSGLSGFVIKHSDDAIGRNVTRTLGAFEAEVAKGAMDKLALVSDRAAQQFYSVGDAAEQIKKAQQAIEKRQKRQEALRVLAEESGAKGQTVVNEIMNSESTEKFAAKCAATRETAALAPRRQTKINELTNQNDELMRELSRLRVQLGQTEATLNLVARETGVGLFDSPNGGGDGKKPQAATPGKPSDGNSTKKF